MRLADPRVDFREGRPFESSSSNAARVDPRFFKLRAPLKPAPALRSVALVRGSAVFTSMSRLGRGGDFGRLGFERSI